MQFCARLSAETVFPGRGTGKQTVLDALLGPDTVTGSMSGGQRDASVTPLAGALLPPRQLAGMFLDGTPQVTRTLRGAPLSDTPPGGGALSPAQHTLSQAAAASAARLPGDLISPRQESRKARWREVLGSPGHSQLLSPNSASRPSDDGGSSTRFQRRASGAAELAAADVTPTAPASLFAVFAQQGGAALPVAAQVRDDAEHQEEAELLMLQRDAAASLRDALVERTAERDAVLARLAVAQGALEDAAALEDELRALRRALADARAEAAREAREQEAAQLRVDEALSVASEASAEVDKLTGEARAARAESARLAADTRRLAAELGAARKEYDAAMRDKAAAEAQLEGERDATRRLREQLEREDAVATEKVRAVVAAARSKAKAEAAAELNAAVRDTADRGRQLVDERVSAAVTAAVAAERETAAALRVRLTSVSGERDAALDMVKRLQHQLEAVTARLGSTEAAMAKAVAERDAALAQASRDGDVATELVAERAAMEEEVAAAAQRALDAEHQRDAALAEARAATAAMKQAEFLASERSAAAAAAREQDGRVSHLESELASRDAQLEAMRTRMGALSAQVEQLQKTVQHHQSLAVEATTAALSAQDALAASNDAAQKAAALAEQRLLDLDASQAQLEETRAELAAMATQPVSPVHTDRAGRLSHGRAGDLFASSPSPSRMSTWSAAPQAGGHPDLELQLAEARVALDVTGTDLTLAVNALEQTAGELDASRAEATVLLAERDTAQAELEVARQHAQRCHAAQELTVAQTQLVAALSATGAPRSVYEEVLTQWIADGRATERDLLERLTHAEQALRRALERESAEAASRWESPARRSLVARGSASRVSVQSQGGIEPQSEESLDEGGEGAFPLAFVSVPVAHSARWATAGMEDDDMDGGPIGEAATAHQSRESVTLAVRMPPTDPAAVLQLREELHDALQRAAAAEVAVSAVVQCAREALNTCPILDADTATPPFFPAADAAVEDQERAACECIDVLLSRALRATALVEVRDSRLRALDLALSQMTDEVARLTTAAVAAPAPAEVPAVATSTDDALAPSPQLEQLRMQLEQARHEARAASVERMAAQQELMSAIGERNAAVAKATAATQARDALATDVSDAAQQLQAARADAERLLQWCQARGMGEGLPFSSPGQPRLSSAAAADVDMYPGNNFSSPLLADPPTPMSGRRLDL